MEEETSKGTKTCIGCRETKSVTEFYPHSRNKALFQSRCKPCQRIHIEGYKLREKRMTPILSWAKRSCYSARIRAARKAIPFALTAFMIVAKAPAVCPVLGIPLDYAVGRAPRTGHNPSTPSVDRIIPELGYTDSNTLVVSCRANTIKSNATPDELRRVWEFYRDLELSRNALDYT